MNLPSRQTLLHRAWIAPWLVFTGLVVLIIPRHEPWFDEAQAWLLARDAGWWELMTRFLRYEGHPGLWHTLLRMFAANGLPYWLMNAFSGLLGIGAAYLFMRYSPFPGALRFLFPFSFFLFYQNTVVARNYSLMAPLLFVVAVIYREKTRKILEMTAVLVLLSHSTFQGFLIAGSILVVHLWDLRKEWRGLDAQTRKRQQWAVGLFALSTIVLVLQLWKPEDAMAPQHGFELTKFSVTLAQMLNAFLVENHALSALILAASLWWFHSRGVLLLYLLPTLLLLVFFGLLYGKPWHEASLFLVWLFALWISFDSPVNAGTPVHRAILASMTCLLGVHLYWSWRVYRADYAWPYSGAKAAAEFIEKHGIHERKFFATGFQSPALSPYFRKNPFKNYNEGNQPAFFWWSKWYKLEDSREHIAKQRPEFLLVPLKFPDDFKEPPYVGYAPITVFQGRMFWKDRFYEWDSYLLLRRDDVILDRALTSETGTKP